MSSEIPIEFPFGAVVVAVDVPEHDPMAGWLSAGPHTQ